MPHYLYLRPTVQARHARGLHIYDTKLSLAIRKLGCKLTSTHLSSCLGGRRYRADGARTAGQQCQSGIPSNSTCEKDHFVPLEMGGADTLDNIWPQRGPSGATGLNRYFKQKDSVETYLAGQASRA
jgi:hypothetical protein